MKVFNRLHGLIEGRRIPCHLREKAENELGWLIQLDIIEKVDGPHRLGNYIITISQFVLN